MTTISRRSALGALGLIGELALARGASAAVPARLVLGTATPGGGFPLYGAAVIDTLKQLDPELAIEPRDTKGSTESSYHGQNAPIPSVGSWSFILARPGLPDDLACRLAHDLHAGEAVLAQRLPQARETTAANTVAAAPGADLIHPGVRRYLHDIGLTP